MSRAITLWFILISATIASSYPLDHATNIVWFRFSESASSQLHRTSKGWIDCPTGVLQLDAILKELRVKQLEPQFYFDPISTKKQVFFDLGMDRDYLIRVPRKFGIIDEQDLAEQLKTIPDIENASIVPMDDAISTPNDWRVENRNEWYLDEINCREAWDHQTGSRSILVATIDTGVDFNHPDLIPNIRVNTLEDLNSDGRLTSADNDNFDDDDNGFDDDVIGYNFSSYFLDSTVIAAEGEQYGARNNNPMDVHGHGTHVAGILAGATNNGIGIVSASHNVQTICIRAGFAYLSTDSVLAGAGMPADFVDAIQYAVNRGCRIISISFAGTRSYPPYQTAIDYARSNNCSVFAGAGNNNTNQVMYPAGNNHVISVAALDRGYRRADFSTYGSWVRLAAPGVDIWSTMVNNRYHSEDYSCWSGTSMATPMAAAAASLLLCQTPSITLEQFEQRILSTSRNVNNENDTAMIGMLGSGCIDPFAAMQLTDDAILNESFETTFPPSGWMIEPVRDTCTWIRGSGFEFGPGMSPHGAYSACFFGVSGAPGTGSRLSTPVVSLRNHPNARLSFNWCKMHDTVGTNAPLEVAISTDDGITWSNLATLSNSTGWEHSEISLSSYSNQSSVRISFYSVSDSGFVNPFVDHVRIDDGTTGVQSSGRETLPIKYQAASAYPNPFNATTKILFDLPRSEFVSLVLFDIQGRKVRSIVNQYCQSGKQIVSFNGENLASGSYFVVLSTTHYRGTTKLVLLK